MKNSRSLLSTVLLASSALAQTVIFPSDYVNVTEGPLNSANLPLARGTSRVQCLYEAQDLVLPIGHQITQVGFREDTTLATLDTGRQLQLEIWMGYSDKTTTTLTTNFANNYVTTPVTVFTAQAYTLPDLRDPANPLTNHQFFIPLTTPFTYAPGPGQSLIVEYRVFGTSGGGAQFNYRLDRADYYSPVTSGVAGCQHSGGGTPVLTSQPTRPGLNYSATMTTGPANSPGLLAINVDAALVPAYPLTAIFAGINPACMGQVSPINLATLGGTSGGSGSASWSFTIPNNPLFSRIHISAQTLFLDFFAPGGLVVSNGSDVYTGLRPVTTIVAASGAPTTVTTGALSQYYAPVAFFVHN